MNNNLQIKVPVVKEQNELMEKMSAAVGEISVRAVSFRLFDALVQFPFSEKSDIFLLMETEFSDIRTSKRTFSELRYDAELEAKKKFTEKCSPKIEQIYDILVKKAGVSGDRKKVLADRECQIAAELAMQRNTGKMLFDSAVKRGKRTIIVADTPYPRNVIINILSRFGYEQCSELIITNEVNGSGDRDEMIYGEILKKSKVKATALLNIGGDIKSDVEFPIMKGSKALLLADTSVNFQRSGRLKGYIKAQRVFDYDSEKCLGIRLAAGLYSAIMLDIPRSKTVHSDFLGNPYIFGFFAYGCCLAGKISDIDEKSRKILVCMEKNSEIKRGGEEFSTLFRSVFEKFNGKISFSGMELPLKLAAYHGDTFDTALLKGCMTDEEYRLWKSEITEPSLVSSAKKTEQNSLEKLADKLFPPGTKVRNIAEGMLFKMKNKK